MGLLDIAVWLRCQNQLMKVYFTHQYSYEKSKRFANGKLAGAQTYDLSPKKEFS